MAFWLLNDPSDHIIKLVTMYNSGAFPYAYRYLYVYVYYFIVYKRSAYANNRKNKQLKEPR